MHSDAAASGIKRQNMFCRDNPPSAGKDNDE
jgi:hypothetical protein